MSLTPQFLDELRARTSLSALIGKTMKLQKAGREYKGCCPFHNEKTPSFYVNDDKGFYHCFGCSAHGDAIRWMTDQRGLPFIDAVKELAQAAGLDMPEQNRRAAQKAERAKGLHDAMADAAAWFSEQLGGLSGGDARELLSRRRVTPETARTFGLGFAPDSRGKLKAALKDYGDPALIECGLLIKVDGKEPYDRFRGRLMIPIRDARGRVIAFGGRIIGDGEPKYLNSPDTPLFDKGRTLYNLDRAAPAVRKSGRVLVVEGYMDVIALAQAGIEEAVAPLGTALTEHQLERLWRMVDVPTLCFDGDAAGQKAAIRAAHRALPLLQPGKSLSFVTLPQGQDPDDLVQEKGAAGFEAVLTRATPLSDLLWQSEIAQAQTDTPEGRAALKQRLEELAQQIPHKDLAYEYKRAMMSRYFDIFGIRKANAEKLRQAVAESFRNPGRGLDYAFKRAVLLGLMRHPSVLSSYIDEVQRLKIEDRYLDKWRSHLVDIAFQYKFLTESLVEQIISQTDVAPIEERNYTRDLAYSFYRRSAPPEQACEDLRHVIEIMLAEAETHENLRQAIDAFKRELTPETFEAQNKAQRDHQRKQSELADWVEQMGEAA
ncbi:DNA primase [Sphingomonas sp. Leaf21]|uniref:DNA primase n=1 Tax=Sphingomonas sp. Leaf21 TaxID=2876550 RepID=UPI001E3756D9|nr:DNA primase [Sphingomonas sp. Leaf21]